MSEFGSAAKGHDRVREAYRRRPIDDPRYSWFSEGHVFLIHQRERNTLRLLERSGLRDLRNLRILDLGCGDGFWMREFAKWGGEPAAMVGIDLLPGRVARAAQLGPPTSALVAGSGCALPFRSANFDLVHLSTVLSSMLEAGMQEAVAGEALRMLRPGGAILWYDFHVDNPGNRDVRGVPEGRIRRLFPGCDIRLQRTTLAPPIARCFARRAWWLAVALERLPFLRTHLLGVIRRRNGGAGG